MRQQTIARPQEAKLFRHRWVGLADSRREHHHQGNGSIGKEVLVENVIHGMAAAVQQQSVLVTALERVNFNAAGALDWSRAIFAAEAPDQRGFSRQLPACEKTVQEGQN